MIPGPPPAPPDVLALTLEEAQTLLEAAGFAVEVQETGPPGRVHPQGARRVVRQQVEGARVQLVVTHEWYERSAPSADVVR